MTTVSSPDSVDPAATAARRFHALSDPTRLLILEQLRDGERCVCDLTSALVAAQSRLSFHLKVLKDAGLVLDRREGRWVHYRLDAEVLAATKAALDTLLTPTERPATQWYSCCA